MKSLVESLKENFNESKNVSFNDVYRLIKDAKRNGQTVVYSTNNSDLLNEPELEILTSDEFKRLCKEFEIFEILNYKEALRKIEFEVSFDSCDILSDNINALTHRRGKNDTYIYCLRNTMVEPEFDTNSIDEVSIQIFND